MSRIVSSISRTALALVLVLSFSFAPPQTAALAESETSTTAAMPVAAQNTAEDSLQKSEVLPSGAPPSERTDPQSPSASGEEAAPAPAPAPVAVTYTVKFFDWDGQLLDTQVVDEGDAAVAPPDFAPNRQGYAFIGWDKPFTNVMSNLDITAQYDELENFSITINYVFTDSTIARQPVVFAAEQGSDLSRTVASPTIAGYSPDQQQVVISLTNIQADQSYTVTYTPATNTPYKVERYQQKLVLVNQSNPRDPVNYDLKDTQNLTGATGSLVVAPSLTYAGFSAPATLPSSQISADGSTTLKAYYDRNQYTVYFSSAGGTYVAPITGLFGAAVTAPANPTRAGYVFDGWSAAVPTNVPAADTTLTAKWKVSGAVSYTLVYYLENIGSTGYDYVGTSMSDGSAGSVPVVPGTIPGSIIFPISTSRIAYNSTKTISELPAAISGDGTTIVNVYYDRQSYSITFQFNAAKYNLTVNGTTYTTSPYTLTAKYGANIETKWPGTPTLKPGAQSDGSFTGWQGNNITYITKQFFMDDAIINNSNATATWSTDSKTVTVYYYLKNLTGSGYTASNTQTVSIDKSFSTWNAKSFQGFTVQQTPVDIQSNNTATFYYDRNQYQVRYYNGGVIDRTTTASYQAAIGGPTFSAAPSIRPASVPAGYTFAGWYTTPQGYDNTKFNFTGATMPANNLILYARWDKPNYSATFDPDNGSPVFAQSVPALNTLTEPAAPTKPGFTFGGWYLPSSQLKYVFSFPVTANLYLKANWIPLTNISYDVIYRKDGVDYSKQTYGGKSVGDSVTANAIAIPGYLPDAVSKSLTLQSSGNQIIFNYTSFTSKGYTVRYVSTLGVDLRPVKHATTSNASVIENYIDIPGYYPNRYQQTLLIGPNENENVITFVYTKNADATYIVRTMLENLDGSYAATDVTKNAPVGIRVTETPQTITGFSFQPSLSVNDRVIASDNSTIIRMVYNRDRFTVSLSAGQHGSLVGATSFANIPYGAVFDTAVPLPTPQADPGYRFDSWSPVLPGTGATVTSNLSFTAQFVRDDAQWATVSFVGNGNTGGTMPSNVEMLIGSQYTLPANAFVRTNFNFVNWDELASGQGISYGDQETITVSGNTVLYAQWVEQDRFAVAYLNNGGTGTMSDTTIYHAGDLVTVQSNTFVYPGYTFAAWKDAGGTTYAGGATFNIQANTQLSAQWDYDASQWAEFVYDANSIDATGSMTSEAVLVNLPHALATNAYERPNYIFTGWNASPDGMGTSYADGAAVTPGVSGPLTLYAQWTEVPKYTITFAANNNTSDTVPVTDYRGSSATMLPSGTFTYDHHDFIRWATNTDGTGDIYFAGSTITLTQDLTLYAFWQARALYTATYNDGFSSGTFSDAQYADIYGNLDVTIAANPFVRQGYTFTEWLSGTGETMAPGTVIPNANTDLTLTAQWTPIEYEVTYDLDGGTVAGTNPTTNNIETPPFELINPTKPGYTFTGWTGTNLTGPTESVTIGQGWWGKLAFKANWTKDPTQWATVTFEGNGSTSGTMPPSAEMLIGSSYTFPAHAFVQTGYNFVNWDTLSSGLGVSYMDQATVTVTGNLTLYAQWVEQNKFAVVYLGNGGTGTMTDTGSYLDSASVTVLDSTFVNPGYKFKEWKDEGGTPYAAASTFAIHANTYLSAQWERDSDQWAEFVYNANSSDATGTMVSEQVLVGSPHTLAANAFSRPNWAFVGWNSEADGTGIAYADGESVTPPVSGTNTLYAQWIRVFYVATFNDGYSGDSFVKPTELNAQGVLELAIPDNPFVRSGYYFDHWQGENGEIVYPGEVITGIESNVSYTAIWSDIGYGIDYDLAGGTVEGVNPETYTPETPTFELINPIRRGYTFVGWTGTGLTEPTLSVSIVQGTEGRLSFTAHWVRDESQWSTISFVTSDATQRSLSGETSFHGIKGDSTGIDTLGTRALPLASESPLVIYPSTVARAGYLFDAWSDAVPSSYPDDDLVITAYWKKAATPLPDPNTDPRSGPVVKTVATGTSDAAWIAQTGDPWSGMIAVVLGAGVLAAAAAIVGIRRMRGRHE